MTSSPESKTAAPDPRSNLRSEQAEQFLLSCCVLDGLDVLARCQEEGITAESFDFPANRIIYGRLLKLFDRRVPIDAAILAEELKTAGEFEAVGGYEYVTRVTSLIPTTAQVEYYIERVRALQILREMAATATKIVEECYGFGGGDIEEFVDRAEQRFMAVTQRRAADRAKPLRESTEAALDVVRGMIERKGELTGISSGFADLDRLTHGFQRQDMIVLAARPSMGKTSLALGFAEAAAMPARGEPKAIIIFSLEMGATQLAMRILCSRARVNMQLLRDGMISAAGKEQSRLLQVAEEVSKAPVFIDDSSAISVLQLRAKARRIHMRVPLGLIIVDYLQLLSPVDPQVPREQQVAEASRGLKSLAKELDVPVVVLSQLNRASEKENRPPKLADLRESGSIEQDADLVLMIGRPGNADEKYQVASDTADVVLAKQRNGPVGEFKLTFLREIARFENFSSGERLA